ncbi:hypothetical protein ACQJBY_013752 [Aegilops geniculata]
MAEGVILLAVTKIGTALGNEVINQASSLFRNFTAQLAELQGRMSRISCELRLMHEFLCRMDVRNRKDQAYEIWMEEVRKVAHRIEDIVDEYLYLVGQRHGIGWRFYLMKGFKQPEALLSLNRIVSLIKEAEASLVHLFKVKDRWVSMANNGSADNSGYMVERSQHLASTSRSISEDLVGVDENRLKLQDLLRNDWMACSTVVLYGMGGLGKTALAANVYKGEREYYDCHAWVSVSQTYSPIDLLRKLLMELLHDGETAPINITATDITSIQDELRKFLEQKKYLIVLDDVWKPEAFSDLLGALAPNTKGSRIVITTRIADVAGLAPERCVLRIECLSMDKSWELFCKKAFRREANYECPMDLKTCSEHIVAKCKGLPLAIVSVGSLLFVREKNPTEWKRINHQLSWELVHNPGLDHVRNILHLSFVYLPTYLKSCFLYCALFPEDYILHRKVLIRLWIAEGFIEERGDNTLEEVAESYLIELVHRNMLQLVERNSFGRIRSCKMHDIVRELAIHLSRIESFGLAYEYGNHGILDTNTRRLAVSKCSNDILSNLQLPRLRSCIIFDKAMPSSRILDSVADKSKYIVVLELRGLSVEKVPSAVGYLFNLRYLGLRNSKVKILPKSIEKLSNLLTLDIINSMIQELPHGIVKLKNLRHLLVERIADLSHRNFIYRHGMRIQKGLSNLTNLQTLHTIEAQDDSIEKLGQLRQVRSLRISNLKEIHCARFCRSLLEMQLLNQLHITMSGESEILQLNELNTPPLNLQKLILRGRLAEGTFQSPLFQIGGQKLRGLYLVWSHLREDPLPSISRLCNLTSLHLTRTYDGEQLIFREGWFPNLKSFVLRDLPDLNQLVIEEGAMESIRTMQLVRLRKLMDVPPGLEFLASLQRLSFLHITEEFLALLNGCTRIEKIPVWYSIEDQPVTRK